MADLQLLANTINDGKAAEFDADAAAGRAGVAGNYYGYYFKQTTDLDLSSITNNPVFFLARIDYMSAGGGEQGSPRLPPHEVLFAEVCGQHIKELHIRRWLSQRPASDLIQQGMIRLTPARPH